MTLDPAAAVLGDDEARVRVAARRQWAARRDLERRLHDGAALRVSALALQLGLLRHRHPADEGEFVAAVENLQDELHLVLQELRDVAGRLYPPLLDEAGLGPALREAAGRCPVPVRVDAPDERFGAAAEGAAYFALLGCLPGMPSSCTGDDFPDPDRPVPAPAHTGNGSNGAGPARSIGIVVRPEGDVLVALVTGVDACHAGPVLDGVRLVGGTVAVEDPAGDLSPGPVTITVRIPCA